MSKFRTLTGYDRESSENITRAMEDYLEMICRDAEDNGFTRVSRLARLLNVKPSSSSKMVENLKELGYIEFEKYGVIRPTKKGSATGDYLLHRHEVLHDFLCLVNGTDDELEQVEKIEHFFDKKTVDNLEMLTIELRNKRE